MWGWQASEYIQKSVGNRREWIRNQAIARRATTPCQCGLSEETWWLGKLASESIWHSKPSMRRTALSPKLTKNSLLSRDSMKAKAASTNYSNYNICLTLKQQHFFQRVILNFNPLDFCAKCFQHCISVVNIKRIDWVFFFQTDHGISNWIRIPVQYESSLLLLLTIQLNSEVFSACTSRASHIIY